MPDVAEASLRPQYFRDAARRAAPLIQTWGENRAMTLDQLRLAVEETAVTYSQMKVELKALENALAADRKAATASVLRAAIAEVVARRTVKPVSQDYLDDVAPAFTGDEVQDFPGEAA